MQIFTLRTSKQANLWDMGFGASKKVKKPPSNSPGIWYDFHRHKKVVGPFYQKRNITGHIYQRMLCYNVFPRLRYYPEGIVFQQDGASSH